MKYPVWRMLFTFNLRPPLYVYLLGRCKAAATTVTHAIFTKVWTELAPSSWRIRRTSLHCVGHRNLRSCILPKYVRIITKYQHTFAFRSLVAYLLSSITISWSTLHHCVLFWWNEWNASICCVVQKVSRRTLIVSDQVWAGAYTCENLADEVTVRPGFLRVCWFSPVNMIPPVVRTFIHLQSYT